MAKNKKTQQHDEQEHEATLLPNREVMSLINPGADGLASLGPLGGGDALPTDPTGGSSPMDPAGGASPTGGIPDTAGTTADHAQSFVPAHSTAPTDASASDQPQDLPPSSSTTGASSET